MQNQVEKELALANSDIRISTLSWEGVEETRVYDGYRLSQRLSDDHESLLILRKMPIEVLSRGQSVGLLPPDCPLKMMPLSKPLRVVYCTFDENWFEQETETTRSMWHKHTNSLVLLRSKRLEILMQGIYSELTRQERGFERIIQAEIEIILMELVRYLDLLETGISAQKGGVTPLPTWQLRRIDERIQASLETGYPTLTELAELCGISLGHLMRTFKASTGWQIQKYIAEKRLTDARRLLEESDSSLKDISEKLGFSNPGYFATVFRRMTGKTPSEYRSLSREKK